MAQREVLVDRTQMERLTACSIEFEHDARRQRLLAKILLAGLSILLSLAIGELLLRHYYPIGDTMLELHGRYLHRYKPNSRRVYRFSAANGGNCILASINGQGRRGELISMSRPHILVYGDSFVSATFTPIKQTFVWQLEQKLTAGPSPAPQVINCGVSGYGPDQESLVLEDEIDSLRPQLVIVSIYTGNDFGDLIRDKIYKLDDQKRLKDNEYTLDPSLVSQFAALEHSSPFYSIRLLKKAWQHLVQSRTPAPTPSSEGYLESWLRDSQSEYEEYIINGNNSVRNLFGDHYDADVSLTPNSKSSQYKRLLMDRVIEKLKQITAARSVPLMLVIIPAAIDVVDNYAPSVNTRKYPEYRRSELTDIVEKIAREYHLPYVNLFRPFRAHGASALYYVVDNDHWNVEGQQLAAGVVAEYIKQQHLLGTSLTTSQ